MVIWRPVDERRVGARVLVHFDNLAGHGRVELAYRLRRLDLATRATRRHYRSPHRQVEEHDVSERVRRIWGDPNGDDALNYLQPLMLARVAKVVRPARRVSTHHRGLRENDDAPPMISS